MEGLGWSMDMELVILIGLQAAGKSTFYRTYFAATHEYVSKDQFRNNKNRARRQTQLIEKALQADRSVVVDNTNASLEERKPLTYLGHVYGAEIIGYYFESQLSGCLERNQKRSGRAQVPNVAIYTTLKKLKYPTYTEGFHKLFSVSIKDSSIFAVSPLLKDSNPHQIKEI